MADYYPLLARAVDGLAVNDTEERGVTYERARQALLDQLRSVQPPLSETDIGRERLALDDAIARVESEAVRRQFEGPERQTFESALPEPEPPRLRTRPASEAAPGRPDAPSAAGGRERPRVNSTGPSMGRRGGGTLLVVAALLLIVAGAIAVTAFVLRDKPDMPKIAAAPAGTSLAPPNAPPPVDPEAKYADRVAGGSRVNAGARAQAPAPRNDVAVAQRAILMEENAADPKTPRISNGRAIWRIENLNAGQGQPLETAVRAEIDVPDVNLALTLQIRRNLDPTLPASHTVLITFRNDLSNPDRVVKDIGLLQLKSEEAVRGTPVAGLPVPVKENVFLIGLSDLRGDLERNIDLISHRNWIDLPIRMVKGQRAILSFEKGVSGEQVVNDALRQWGQI